MVEKIDPDRFQMLLEAAQQAERQRYAIYRHLAGLSLPGAQP
jgi:hypothetical protein